MKRCMLILLLIFCERYHFQLKDKRVGIEIMGCEAAPQNLIYLMCDEATPRNIELSCMLIDFMFSQCVTSICSLNDIHVLLAIRQFVKRILYLKH